MALERGVNKDRPALHSQHFMVEQTACLRNTSQNVWSGLAPLMLIPNNISRGLPEAHALQVTTTTTKKEVL